MSIRAKKIILISLLVIVTVVGCVLFLKRDHSNHRLIVNDDLGVTMNKGTPHSPDGREVE